MTDLLAIPFHMTIFPETTLRTHSPEETERLGEQLGLVARDGDVIGLVGELGAGKTTLVKGLARAMGIKARITSPTFTVVQEYSGRIRLYHVDCYRLAGPEDLEPLGADDWLGSDGVTVLEWAGQVRQALPADYLEIALSTEDDSRVLQVRALGPESSRLACEAGFHLGAGGGSARNPFGRGEDPPPSVDRSDV